MGLFSPASALDIEAKSGRNWLFQGDSTKPANIFNKNNTSETTTTIANTEVKGTSAVTLQETDTYTGKFYRVTDGVSINTLTITGAGTNNTFGVAPKLGELSYNANVNVDNMIINGYASLSHAGKWSKDCSNNACKTINATNLTINGGSATDTTSGLGYGTISGYASLGNMEVAKTAIKGSGTAPIILYLSGGKKYTADLGDVSVDGAKVGFVKSSNGAEIALNSLTLNSGAAIDTTSKGSGTNVTKDVIEKAKTLTINSGATADFGTGGFTINSGKTTTINGGTLKAGTLTNSGTLTFAMGDADSFGQLDGKLSGNGTVNVDATGAQIGTTYTLVTDESGLGDTTPTLTGSNTSYLEVAVSDKKGITLNKSAAFTQKQAQLGENKGGIAEKLLTSSVNIDTTSAINDTDDTIKQSYIATPQQLISNFKANSVNNVPLGQGLGAAFAPTAKGYGGFSKPTANADLLRFDNGYAVNSLVNEPKIEFFANPFLGELRGNGVKGRIGGIGLGVGYLSEGYALQGSFTYASADSSQDLATQSTETNANLFQVGLLGQLYFADLVEIDINANYLLGKFKLNNTWFADSAQNSSSKFNNHQGNVGVAAGLRFGSEFSIKPFVGLQNYFESQGSYTVLGFESEKYSDYALNGVAGIEGRAKIGDLSFLYARVSGEFNFVNSQKELFMRDGANELKYENETYKNTISAGLGAQIYATDNAKFSIEGLYKYHDSGLNYYGGSLGIRLVF